MRNLVIAGLLTIVAAPLAAQGRAWSTEIGIQGGFTRISPTGGGAPDHVDLFDLPGQSYVGGALSYGAVYLVLPMGGKLALEPSFNLTYLTTAAGTTNNTALYSRLGLRGNYALTDHVYAAAGAQLVYVDGNPGTGGTQVFAHLAAGYRFRLNPVFGGRVEAGFSVADETDVNGSNAVYTLLFGLSARTGGGAPAPARRTANAARWQRRLGFQGGWSTMSEPEGDFTASFISAPLIGGSVTTFAVPVASPPTVFLVFPVGQRVAIEAGADVHRAQGTGGNATSASANLSGRLLFSVKGNWYAAGGLNINYIKRSGVDGGVLTGANVGWGYEFPVRGNWRGRTELNFQAMKEDTDLGAGAQNVLSLLFALSVPLK